MPDVHSRRRTVLLVEDEENVRRLLARFLSDAGYEVLPTGDIDSAFVALRRSSIDAVVTDVRLAKDRSGLEVLEFVRLDEEKQDVPVIILTGTTLSSEEEDIIRRYPAYVFYKPHGYSDLVQFLKTRFGD